MFLSIPKEFFVNVVFSDKFILNTENNNMEFDTSGYRESTKTISAKKAEKTEQPIENKVKEVEVVPEQKVSETNMKEVIKNKCEIEMEEFKAKSKDVIYIDIDDEYVDDTTKIEDDSCE